MITVVKQLPSVVIITRWSVAVDLTFVLVTLRRAWWLLLLIGRAHV